MGGGKQRMRTSTGSVANPVALAALLVLMIGAAARPAIAQTPAQDVSAAMQGALGAQVQEGCSSELTRYCPEVTPGEARLLACLYAHGDKLSGPCEFALYDAAARLERAIGAITYVASECRAELETHCADVEVGEGRVAQCLKDHASELGPGCDQALTNVGVK
jgi:Cysteine rich repeat